MLPRFPEPYPEESIYSILCRLRTLLDVDAKTLLKLFDNRLKLEAQDFLWPICINRIVSKIPPYLGITSERLLVNHSIVPFFRVFSDEKFYKEANRIALDGGNRRNTIIKGSSKLRFCSRCVQEDRDSKREPYFRRSHQLMGVEACWLHGVQLGILEQGGIAQYQELSHYEATLSSRSIPAHPVFKMLAEDIQNSLSWDTIGKKAMLERLAEIKNNHDLMKKPSADNRGFRDPLVRYIREVKDQFPSFAWVDRGVVHWEIKRSVRILNPYKILILLRSINVSPEKFFCHREYVSEQTPKWPCRNPLCNLFGKDVALAEQMKGNIISHRNIIIKCPECQFAYKRRKWILFRRTLERKLTEKLVIHDFGDLWTSKFKSLWMNHKYSYNAICREMRYAPDHHIFFEAASRLGLPLNRGGAGIRTDVMRKYLRRTSCEKQKIDHARSILKKLRKDNPEFKIEQARKMASSEYYVACSNDQLWDEFFSG